MKNRVNLAIVDIERRRSLSGVLVTIFAKRREGMRRTGGKRKAGEIERWETESGEAEGG